MSSSSSEDLNLHKKLSKKVAQLTKVIVQLNKINESQTRLIDAHEGEKKRWIDSHKAEKEEIRGAHAAKIKLIADEVHGRVNLLREEADAKVCSLEELLAASKVREKDANDRLESIQREAKDKVEALESNHERERASHAQALRDISQSLEEQSRQHQENLLFLRREMEGAHKKRVEVIREEINADHAEEFEVLKSQHEQTLVCIKSTASEREKSAVKNAVANVRVEYEEKLSKQLASHDEKCETIKAEAAKKMSREMNSLKQDLDRIKVQAESKERELLNDMRETKEALGFLAGNEKKLSSEIKRLQTMLDATSLSNQKIINEQKQQNAQLLGDVKEAREASDDRLGRIESLEAKNDQLKALCDTIDEQNTSLEAELTSLSIKNGEERQINAAKSQERETRIRSLEAELNDANTALDLHSDQLLIAQEEISGLLPYKECALQSLKALKSLQTDVNQCRIGTAELTQLFASTVEGLVDWKHRLQEQHSNETLRLIDHQNMLQSKVDRLRCRVVEYESAIAEAKTTLAHREKKINYLEETSANAETARIGERISWEQAIQDTKAQHKKELARTVIMAQDEQDILGNQIEELKESIKKQSESHERKCQLMDLDWGRRVEDRNTALSQIKYESALEIQGLSRSIEELSGMLASREAECKTLTQNINSMREQQEIKEIEYRTELDSLSKRHQHDLEEGNVLHEQQVKQKDEEIERIELEKHSSNVLYEQRISAFKGLIASERSGRINELRGIKRKLNDLSLYTSQNIEDIKREWESLCTSAVLNKLARMKQRHDERVERYNKEISQLQNAIEGLDMQLSARTDEAKEAKFMLFNTIREWERKLERSLRDLREDHVIEMKTLASERKIQYEIAMGKIKDLTKEYESLACANAKKVDVIIEKDRDINQLKNKMSDTVKEFDEEIQSIRLQHESERAAMMADAKAQEANIIERGAREKSELRFELQSKIDAVNQQLREANKRWDSRPSLPRDLEQIKELQNEIQTLSVKETQARENMMFFKLELENREDTFNKRFSDEYAAASSTASPLRVLRDDNVKRSIERKKPTGSTARRKMRGKAGSASCKGASRKKKVAASGKLPKIAK